MRTLVALVAAVGLATGAVAADATVQASNGLKVRIVDDEFKPTKWFVGPMLSTKKVDTEYQVVQAVSRDHSDPDQYLIQGRIVYEGSGWRLYRRAYLKGGVPVRFEAAGSNVFGCRGGCSYRESFIIALTGEQLEAVMSAGELVAQVASEQGADFLVTVPAAHFKAVAEIASAHP